MQIVIQTPKLACDISIVIKSILSNWPIENQVWRPFFKMATGKYISRYTAVPKLAELIYLCVKINVLNILKSPLNVS